MRRKTALLLLVVLLVCSGCIPSITWLPDSSGFVYTAGRHGEQLMYFNLAKKEPQTLVEDTKCETLRPAVSPDGKRIALAKITHVRNEPDQWQILVFDLMGELVQSSRVFSEKGFVKDEIRFEQMVEVFWSSPNFILIQKLTVSDKGNTRELVNAGGFILYDLKSDRMAVERGGRVLSFGGSPFRTDGKYFLTCTGSGENDRPLRLLRLDLKGNLKEITLKGPASKSEYEWLWWFSIIPSLSNSSWQGNVAIVTSHVGRLEIDTERLEASFQPDPSYSPDSKEKMLQEVTFSNGRWSLQAWIKSDKVKPDKDDKKPEDSWRLLLWDLKQKKAQVLSDKADGAFLFPSPNGKYVAVRWYTGERWPPIWVIDQNGKIVAKFKER